MDKNCVEVNISDYSFLRLLVSSIILKGQNPIIVNNKLERNLYSFFNREQYNFLFEDICKKSDVFCENDYVDLSRAFQQAYALGLIFQVHSCLNEMRTVINISMHEAKQIQSQYSQEQIKAMSNMVDEMFKLRIDKGSDKFVENDLINEVPALKKVRKFSK